MAVAFAVPVVMVFVHWPSTVLVEVLVAVEGRRYSYSVEVIVLAYLVLVLTAGVDFVILTPSVTVFVWVVEVPKTKVVCSQGKHVGRSEEAV